MGYYTKYNLNYTTEKGSPNQNLTEEDITTLLSEITDYFSPNTNFDEAFWEEMKWYGHQEDMLELSRKVPDVLFELNGFGEDREDNWIKYFKNGNVQICRGDIVYEPFNPDYFD